MDIEEVAMLAAGYVALLAGLGVIVFRDATAKRNQANVETKLGKWFPGLSSESTPARMVGVGIACLGVGVILVFRSLS